MRRAQEHPTNTNATPLDEHPTRPRARTAITTAATYWRQHPTDPHLNLSQSLYDRWRNQLTPTERKHAPSVKAIRHTYGSWNEAVQAAGLTANKRPRDNYARTLNDPAIAQAAIQEWLTWQNTNMHLAPIQDPIPAWRRSRPEYEHWRDTCAPNAPTHAIIQGTLGPLTEIIHTSHTWPTPTPDTLTTLYRIT